MCCNWNVYCFRFVAYTNALTGGISALIATAKNQNWNRILQLLSQAMRYDYGSWNWQCRMRFDFETWCIYATMLCWAMHKSGWHDSNHSYSNNRILGGLIRIFTPILVCASVCLSIRWSFDVDRYTLSVSVRCSSLKDPHGLQPLEIYFLKFYLAPIPIHLIGYKLLSPAYI